MLTAEGTLIEAHTQRQNLFSSGYSDKPRCHSVENQRCRGWR